MRITKLLSSLLFGAYFRFSVDDPNGGGGGGGGGTPPANQDARSTFSREYVSELREEAKMWRLKFQERESALTEAAGKLTAAEKAAQEAQTAAAKAADERVLRAELKAVAIKHGVVDVTDALKVLDLSTVKLDADGNLTGADELFEAAKKSKAYLFGAQNTGSTEKKPPPAENTPKDVRKLSAAEYEAEKAKMIAASRKR
ncbi:TPA: hypothetical protein SAO08_002656 [Burkholderia multivorans]|nr:hypothetical protein [Burkholderia multivorans]